MDIEQGALEQLGYSVVAQGWLLKLRDYMGLSRNAMAELMGVSSVTLKRWESGEVRVWGQSAAKIGQFHVDALFGLTTLNESGHEPDDLVLLDRVPGMLGSGVVTDLEAKVRVVDLGVLGMYTLRSDVEALRNG